MAKFDADPGCYLFACNANRGVVGDLYYHSSAEAMADAKRCYETDSIDWIRNN